MKPELLLMQSMLDRTEKALEGLFEVHRLFAAADKDGLLQSIGPRIRAVATGGALGLPRTLMDQCPRSRSLQLTVSALMRSIYPKRGVVK